MSKNRYKEHIPNSAIAEIERNRSLLGIPKMTMSKILGCTDSTYMNTLCQPDVRIDRLLLMAAAVGITPDDALSSSGRNVYLDFLRSDLKLDTPPGGCLLSDTPFKAMVPFFFRSLENMGTPEDVIEIVRKLFLIPEKRLLSMAIACASGSGQRSDRELFDMFGKPATLPLCGRFSENLAEKLAAARPSELAKASGVQYSLLLKYAKPAEDMSNSVPRTRNLQKLIKALGISANELFYPYFDGTAHSMAFQDVFPEVLEVFVSISINRNLRESVAEYLTAITGARRS